MMTATNWLWTTTIQLAFFTSASEDVRRAIA